ncbi:MAG: helix-turn-helix domain-containing protein [Leptospirales bacterium]
MKEAKQGVKTIARALNLSKNTVRKYLRTLLPSS